jgi:kynurenine 3-monooxygenase
VNPDVSASSPPTPAEETAPQRSVQGPFTILGAGPAGSLLALLLQQRGVDCSLYERRADPRRAAADEGRSINLALAERGIEALKRASIFEQVEPLLIPMHGRMMHDPQGVQKFTAYGQSDQAIYSVERTALNNVLIQGVEARGGRLHFGQSCTNIDFATNLLQLFSAQAPHHHHLPLHHVIAADGAGSAARRSMAEQLGVACFEERLPHGYKELTIPARAAAEHPLDPNALHIWPRGGFMLIALPNLDGSFTATLFLPFKGPMSFAELETPASVVDFFARHFPDALALMPRIGEEFINHPIGSMTTVSCARWSVADRLCLIGDAAHAIVPFHGQGMNSAFEDCVKLDALLAREADGELAFAVFEQRRQHDSRAIAKMALENYVEMRESVRSPEFQLQKALSLEMERRFPERFVPRYSMVMFRADIPYSTAYERGAIQARILEELTRDRTDLQQVDFELAQQLIEKRLAPIQGGRV